MSDGKITIQLPTEIASALIAEGAATEAIRSRGSSVDMIVTVATTATTLITLAQGPQSLNDVFSRLRSWWGGRAAIEEGPATVTVTDGDRRVTIDLATLDDAVQEELLAMVSGH